MRFVKKAFVCCLAVLLSMGFPACSGNVSGKQIAQVESSPLPSVQPTLLSDVSESVELTVDAQPYSGTVGTVDVSKTSPDKLGILCDDIYFVINHRDVASDIDFSGKSFKNDVLEITTWNNTHDGFTLHNSFGLGNISLTVDYDCAMSKNEYLKGKKYTSDVTSLNWYFVKDEDFCNFYHFYSDDDVAYIRLYYPRSAADKKDIKPSDVFDKFLRYLSVYGYNKKTKEPFYYKLGPSQTSDFKKVNVSSITPFTSILAKRFADKDVKIADVSYLIGFDSGELMFSDSTSALYLKVVDSDGYCDTYNSFETRTVVMNSVFNEMVYDSGDVLMPFVASRDDIHYEGKLGVGSSSDIINVVLRK